MSACGLLRISLLGITPYATFCKPGPLLYIGTLGVAAIDVDWCPTTTGSLVTVEVLWILDTGGTRSQF